MLAEITRDGTLTIKAETDLEVFALDCWSKGKVDYEKILIDLDIDEKDEQ